MVYPRKKQEQGTPQLVCPESQRGSKIHWYEEKHKLPPINGTIRKQER